MKSYRDSEKRRAKKIVVIVEITMAAMIAVLVWSIWRWISSPIFSIYCVIVSSSIFLLVMGTVILIKYMRIARMEKQKKLDYLALISLIIVIIGVIIINVNSVDVINKIFITSTIVSVLIFVLTRMVDKEI